MRCAIVSRNGRITIPTDLRKKYRIREGMKVALLEIQGKLSIEPITKNFFHRFAGILGTDGKALKSLMEDKKREREL
jgi:AbrB family looped-hinge helix DNA binding protein